MEVVHFEENTSNVVIGGGKSRAFSIANTAEFVSVLSDALYSHKNLAVIREVMCNAWDAHISAGITDHQIEVTISESSLMIRDYGKGIPDDAIADIYCTYGESTKRQETATTGGFGLGSKSPFAISDFFTVTSFHGGTKTVYAVSKGSEETDGLPELKTMVTIPTTETGVLVEVPLTDSVQYELYRYAVTISKLGEMKALIQYKDTLHYNEGNEIGLKDSDNGYTILMDTPGYLPTHDSKIFVQYGAVVYSVDYHAELEPFYSKLTDLFSDSVKNGLPSVRRGFLLIKAEDSSLSVAPSRETLSYSKQCLANLKTLLAKVSDNFESVDKSKIANLYRNDAKRFIKNYGPINNLNDLLGIIKDFAYLKKIQYPQIVEDQVFLNTKKDIENLFLAPRYNPKKDEFTSIHHKTFINHIQSFNKPKWTKIAKSFSSSNSYKLENKAVDWRKYFFKEAYKFFGNDVLKYCKIYKKSYDGFNKITSIKAIEHASGDMQPFDVFISNNISSIKNYVSEYLRETGKSYGIVLCINLPKNQKKYDVQEVADHFEGLDFKTHRIYDMMKFHPVKNTTASVSAGKKKTGFSLFSDLVKDEYALNKNLTDVTRITDPEAVTVLNIKRYGRSFVGVPSGCYQAVIRNFPKTVVVSNDTVSHTVQFKQNIPTVTLAIIKLLKAAILDNNFIEYIACRGMHKYSINSDFVLYERLMNIPEIKQEFGLSSFSGSVDMEDTGLFWDYYHTSLPQSDRENFAKAVKDKSQSIFNRLPYYSEIKLKRHLLDKIDIDNIDELSPDDRKLMLDAYISIMKG